MSSEESPKIKYEGFKGVFRKRSLAIIRILNARAVPAKLF